MIKAVIFDLDDTLISEEDYIRSGYRAVAGLLASRLNLGQNKIAKELFSLYRQDARLVFNRLLEKYGVPVERENILELVEVYRTHVPRLDFFEDVIPVLTCLRKKGFITGVISDGYVATQERKVQVLKLEELVDRVILTDRLGRDYWKPDVRSFSVFAQEFGISYEEMMYVGDNPTKDFYMKKQLPITAVRIYRPNAVYAKAAYLEGVKEDYTVESLYELDRLLQKERCSGT